MRRCGVLFVAIAMLSAFSTVACQGGMADPSGHGLYRPADLPAPVAETRGKLLAAAQSGDLSRLKPILAEVEHFAFSYSVDPDPIAYWRDIRERRGGKPVLRSLAQVLALPAARTDQQTFVWPYLAELSPRRYEELSPETAADVSLLMTRAAWNERAAEIGYAGYRVTIRADGTWTRFIAGD